MQDEREEGQGEEQQEPSTGAGEEEKVIEQPPEKVTKPTATKRIRKPKVKKIPTLERGKETRLQYLAAGNLFEIGGVLYRFLGNDVRGFHVITVTPIPGGFSTGRELTMGANTICLPVEIV